MEPEPLPLAPEALLEQGEWVRRVARALVLDEHRAEDLAQQVWVKALERPPTVRVSLRAWLGTVLRNAAADLRRGGARRRVREEAAARDEALPSTEAVVARAETLHRVSAAALALREPYRTVILLRYFEDLAPPEIARRLDVPLETVRTRLRRGLETLREDLDGDSGDRRAWVLALLPLAVPGLRLPSAPAAAPAVPGAWTGGDVAARAALATAKEIGAMTVRNAVATGLAILVSVGAALWFLRDVEPEHGTDPSMAAAGGRRGKPKAPPPAAPEVGGVGYIGSSATEHPMPPIHIPTGKEWEEAAKKKEMPPFTLDVEERARLQVLTLDTVKEAGVVDAWGQPLNRFEAVPKTPALVVRGLVVDADTGSGIGGVPLQAYPSNGSALEVTSVSSTDGTFEIRGSFKGSWSLAAGWRDSSSDYGYSLVKRKGPPEGDLRVELRRGLALEGRIEDADGKPYAGDATVLSWALDGKGKAIPESQQWVFSSTGTFRIRGLDPGPHVVHASAHPKQDGTAEPGVTGIASPVEPGAKEIVVRLPRAAAIEGRIVDQEGNPVAGKGRVRILTPGGPGILARRFRDFEVPGDGTFRSTLLDPGEVYDLEASGFEGYQVLKKEGVAGGATGVVLVLVREE